MSGQSYIYGYPQLHQNAKPIGYKKARIPSGVDPDLYVKKQVEDESAAKQALLDYLLEWLSPVKELAHDASEKLRFSIAAYVTGALWYEVLLSGLHKKDTTLLLIGEEVDFPSLRTLGKPQHRITKIRADLQESQSRYGVIFPLRNGEAFFPDSKDGDIIFKDNPTDAYLRTLNQSGTWQNVCAAVEEIRLMQQSQSASVAPVRKGRQMRPREKAPRLLRHYACTY